MINTNLGFSYPPMLCGYRYRDRVSPISSLEGQTSTDTPANRVDFTLMFYRGGAMRMRIYAVALVAVATLGWSFLAYATDISVKRSPDIGDHFFEVKPDAVKLTTTCTMYVPAYSQIFLSEKAIAALAVTLSIRNIDPTNRIIIRRIEYFDTKGTLVDKLVTGLFALAPMATASFVIEQRDMRGGAGANFIVDWAAEANVNQPVIEAIMAGYEGTKGLSFSSRGVPLSGCQTKP